MPNKPSPSANPAEPSAALAVQFKAPFDEQVAFFRQKLGNLVPTAKWDDLWHSQHDKGFMVAGAAKADLLADLAGAVDKAIASGESLDAFRKRFADIVGQHGWHGWTGEGTKAGQDWRTRIIYQTNLSASYSAGRLAQLRAGGYSHYMYKHADSVLHPRPHHVALNGVVEPADSAFWQTHYPPNGWGCRCRVVGVRNPAQATRLGGDWGKQAPDWASQTDAKTGEPVGVDKGWGYMPGGTVAADVARAVATKTIAWPYELAKAYMTGVPATARDALALAQRSAPETAQAVRRYAERALGMRNGAPIDPLVEVQPYQTMGLLTQAEGAKIAKLTGVNSVKNELWDWTLDRYAPKHIQGEHGDAVVEAKRGQRPPLPDDYAHLAALLADPATRWWVEDAGKTLMAEQTVGADRYVTAWTLLSKRRMVALKSMRIYSRSPRAQRP